jgi:hypothetical protein
MRIFSAGRNLLAALLLVIAAQLGMAAEVSAEVQPISIFIVRHAETDLSQPSLPLTAIGRQRAELLTQTLRGIKFTHIFSSHTTRTRQMVEGIAAAQNLPIVQLPVPGSILDGQPVTEQTSRRAPIEPISAALLKLPPGSIALVALNSENIFAILNRLGVPLAPAGTACTPGSLCVPCTDNSCYPLFEYDHLWQVVRMPDVPQPLVFTELRYAAGWHALEH